MALSTIVGQQVSRHPTRQARDLIDQQQLAAASHHEHRQNHHLLNHCHRSQMLEKHTRVSVRPCRGADNNLVAATWLMTLALLFVGPAHAYPSGAPEQACKDLRPGHGAEPQTGAAPFELSQDRLQVGAGEQIKVTLSSPSGTNFKGLIVQASNEAGEPRGKFLPGTGLKALDSCSAVTHSDKEAKKTATLVWQAPDELKAKEAFVFRATVVKKFDEIYTNIKSSLKSGSK